MTAIDVGYVHRLAGQHAAQGHAILAELLHGLADECAALRACLYEVTATEVDEYDPRVGYVEVQVDPRTWAEALRLAGREAAAPTVTASAVTRQPTATYCRTCGQTAGHWPGCQQEG